MKRVAVVYFSCYGHTEKVAEHIGFGVQSVDGVFVDLFNVERLGDVEILNAYDAIIFGAPTYMGSVPYQYKKFMDGASKVWLKKSWKGKLAGGFTNAGSLSGDKFNVLMQLCTFACQHGMVWISLGIDNESKESGDLQSVNRMGSSLGLMTQSDNDSPEVTPPVGDRKTAELFGIRIAKYLLGLM